MPIHSFSSSQLALICFLFSWLLRYFLDSESNILCHSISSVILRIDAGRFAYQKSLLENASKLRNTSRFDALSVVATASRPATAKSVRPFDPALHPQPWPFPVEMGQRSHGVSSLVPPGTLSRIRSSTDIPWDIRTRNSPVRDRTRRRGTPVTALHRRNPSPQPAAAPVPSVAMVLADPRRTYIINITKIKARTHNGAV